MGFWSVVLLILKIIGIVLASVIGLILLLLLVVLLVPFRYRFEGHKLSDIRCCGRITWLLHLLKIEVIYTGTEKVLIQVRVFGKLFYDSAGLLDNKKKKRRKKKTKAKEEQEESVENPQEESSEAGTKPETGAPGTTEDTVKSLPEESMDLPTEDEGFRDSDTARSEEQAEEEKQSLFYRIKCKITEIAKKIWNALTAPIRWFYSLRYRYRLLAEFLKTQENKSALGLSWKIIKKLLNHMKPRRIKGYITYGTGDPANTGYILAVLGVFYARYGKQFRITPVFDDTILEGELKMRGRIMTCVLLTLFIKLWFNKDFKSLRTNFDQFTTDFKKPYDSVKREEENGR